jgi:hypothetical protein
VDTAAKQKPSWLAGWSVTGTFVENDRGQRIPVYHRLCPAGTTIRTGHGHPLIAATYDTAMPPAYDLKPVQHYRISQARHTPGGVQPDQFAGRDCLTFRRPSGDTIAWTIRVGIAGRYDIRIGYANAGPDTLSGILRMTSPEGEVLLTKSVRFEPAKQKWRTVSVMTPTAVNAGTYTVQLIGVAAKGLHVSKLEVQ